MESQRTVDVQYRDGQSEAIVVSEATIRQLETLVTLVGKDAERAELYAGREAGWADSLCNPSVEALLEAGDALNFIALQKLRERRARETRLLLQFLEEAEGVDSKHSSLA